MIEPRPRVDGRDNGHRFSRRKLVSAAGALAIGATLLPVLRGLVSPAQQPRNAVAGRSLDLAAFAALSGQRFSATDPSGSGPVDLKLESVTEWSPHGSPGAGAAHAAALVGGEYFTLTFSGPASQKLAQDTYQLQHARTGLFPLFIVPGADGNRQQVYSAVIGRLPESGAMDA